MASMALMSASYDANTAVGSAQNATNGAASAGEYSKVPSYGSHEDKPAPAHHPLQVIKMGDPADGDVWYSEIINLLMEEQDAAFKNAVSHFQQDEVGPSSNPCIRMMGASMSPARALQWILLVVFIVLTLTSVIVTVATPGTGMPIALSCMPPS